MGVKMKNLKIILADEDSQLIDSQLIDSLDKNFKSIGCVVVATTKNGDELIELINKHQPDLVVMDIVLEGSDGFKVL